MTVSLTSQWFVAPDCMEKLLPALHGLASDIRAHEPQTLTYLIHRPLVGDARLQSLPPSAPELILFYEIYADAQAFLDHVNGPIFQRFVKDYGDCFLQANGKPFTTVRFLDCIAGFSAREAAPDSGVSALFAGAAVNQHPVVMFEIIARDAQAARAFYSSVFGWTYQFGTGDFAYIHFPDGAPHLLGGIGQADPSVPGFEPGHNFYLLVDRLEHALQAALSAGGTALMPPTGIDGYRFAMFRDPEGNPVGIIEPFQN